ncbi:condensation domain-containing protein, partial [Acidisoma sp. C75]
MSAAQRGVWLGQELRRESAAYIIGELLRFDAPIDAVLLSRAVDAVIARTRTLHARFAEAADGVWQEFVPPAAAALRHVFLPDTVALEDWIAEDLRQAALQFRERPFGFALITLGSGQHFLLQRYHHLVMDGAGGAEIVRRLAAAYSEGAATGRTAPHPLDDLDRLLDADEDYAGSAAEAADRAYWHRLLGPAPEPVLLGPGTAPPGDQHLTLPLAPDDDLTTRFAAAAEAAGLGLPQSFAAAVAILVQALLGRDALLLNLAARGLRGPRLRDVPAMTSNSLPLPVSLDPAMRFADLARQIAAGQRAALRHSRYRGEILARDLLPARLRSFGPAVNVMAFDYA